MKLPDIICTLTPERISNDWLDKLVQAGMTCIRINASHLNALQLEEMLKLLTAYRHEHPQAYKIMLDLPGPEFRVFGYEQPLTLDRDGVISITSHRDDALPAATLRTNLQWSAKSAWVNHPVRFMNGELEGVVTEVSEQLIQVRISQGGLLRPNAHIFIEGITYSLPFFGEHDLKFIQSGMKEMIDQLALSLVRTPADIDTVKAQLMARGIRKLPELVVKIETRSAIDCLEQLTELADALIVARGDLGMEVKPEAIPLIQKQLLALGKQRHKPVYIATQILSSMLHSIHPTRAELSDLANAMLEGAAGFVLSEETAIGDYAVEAVAQIRKVVEKIFSPDKLLLQSMVQEHDLEQRFWEILTGSKPYGREIRDLQSISQCLWHKGWAEANAGNVSLLLDPTSDPQLLSILQLIYQQSGQEALFDFAELEWYLVSASGSRFREYSGSGFGSFVLIGTKAYNLAPVARTSIYQDKPMLENPNPMIVFPDTRPPTSEWITHHLTHDWLRKNRPAERVILHSHITDWIIISKIREYHNKPEELIKYIRSLLPELDICLPKGFAIAEFAPSGSSKLAEATLKYLPRTNIIVWEAHGVFITAENFNQAYDRMELLGKAAQVYLGVQQLGMK